MRTLGSYALITGLATLIMVGTACKPSLEQQVVGHWTGKMELPKGAADNPFAKAMAGAMTPSLDVKNDKTFAMTMVFPIEGTWEIAGGKLSLHPTKVMGMDISKAKEMADQQAKSNPMAKGMTTNTDQMDKPILLDMASDGKTMTAENPDQAAKGGSLTFTKNSGG